MSDEPTSTTKPPTADTPALAPASPAPAPASPEAPKPAPAPQLDPDKLSKQLLESFKEGVKEMVSGATSAPPAQPAQSDPLAAVVAPIVAPAMQQIGVRAESAMDAATFYADADPTMAAFKAKHKGRIEELFGLELKAQRFTPRDAILSYLRGGELFKETVEAEVASRKAAEDKANAALTAGPGGARTQPGAAPKDAWKMTPEELDKELADIPF